MNTVYINGAYLPRHEAKISIDDRSYLFGEGLFETFRSYGGQFPFLKSHLNRLTWSATFLNLEIPDAVHFEQILLKLLEINNLSEARCKIILSRQTESESIKSESISTPNLVITCEPFIENSKSRYKIKTAVSVVADAAPLATLKTTQYLTKILARAEAQEAGLDDAVLVNSRGNVTETASGNIFWVDEKNNLKTVSELQGNLRGVTKMLLIELFREKNLICREDIITPIALSNMREIFITNAVHGIIPVISMDGRQISGGDIGSITAMVQDLWKQKINNCFQQ